MGNASNRAKTKWNASHYKQQKFSVDPEIAAAFKTACETAGVSMASEISRFMVEYSATKPKQKAASVEDMSTRRKRRKIVVAMTLLLESVMHAEMSSHDNVPENLRNSIAYEENEERISAMEEALELLGSIY